MKNPPKSIISSDRTEDAPIKFKSGAVRSSKVPRYDLIPKEGVRRLALRYQMGLEKYTRDNWRKGLHDAEYIDQVKCHIVDHLFNYLEVGCICDDELAAVVWGCFFLMEAEKYDKPQQL